MFRSIRVTGSTKLTRFELCYELLRFPSASRAVRFFERSMSRKIDLKKSIFLMSIYNGFTIRLILDFSIWTLSIYNDVLLVTIQFQCELFFNFSNKRFQAIWTILEFQRYFDLRCIISMYYIEIWKSHNLIPKCLTYGSYKAYL